MLYDYDLSIHHATNLLIAEFIEWSALFLSSLHCLHPLTQAIGRIVHEEIEEGDLSKTNGLLSKRAEHVKDPYWPLLFPVSNHRVE